MKNYSHLLITFCILFCAIELATSRELLNNSLADYEDQQNNRNQDLYTKRTNEKSNIDYFNNSAKDSNLVVIGKWTGGKCYSVCVENNIAYFGKDGFEKYDPHSLEIVDISDTLNPHELGNVVLSTQYVIRDITVNGKYAYLAVDSSGLLIIDISNPTSPYEIGYCDTEGSAYGIMLSGENAFIADGKNGLRIIDVSDPINPIEIGFFDIQGSASGVAISQDRAFVADEYKGLLILDVSDPTNPIELRQFEDYGSNVKAIGNYAYTAGGVGNVGGMSILDISNPSIPIKIGYFNAHWPVSNFTVNGNYAYLANDYDGFRIIDISDPTKPTEVAHYGGNTYYYDIALSGDFAYIGLTNGLLTVNISDPRNPRGVDLFKTRVDFNDIFISGGFAYVSDSYYGLRIFNIMNPSQPIQTGYFEMLFPEKIVIRDEYAYIVGVEGFKIIDISDPSHPLEVIFIELHGLPSDIAVYGDYAYITELTDVGGLRVFNISDPKNPIETYINKNLSGYSITVNENFAYVTSATELLVFDLKDPSKPVEVGSYYIYENYDVANDILLIYDYAFIATDNKGILIIDISNPSNPNEIGLIGGGYTPGLSNYGSIVCVATGYNGLMVMDVFNLSNPIKLGYLDIDNDSYQFQANKVFIDDKYSYVAYGEYGFCIVGNELQVGTEDLSEKLTGNINLQIIPNPFNTSTIINYSLQFENYVNLSVFDISGREIISLINQRQTRGTYNLEFNSSNLSKGIYFCKLQIGSRFISCKMVILH